MTRARFLRPVRVMVGEFEDACRVEDAEVELSIVGAVEMDKRGRLSLAANIEADLGKLGAAMPADVGVSTGVERSKDSTLVLHFTLSMKRK